MTQTSNVCHRTVELVQRFAACLIKDSKNEKDMAFVKQLAPYIAYFNKEMHLSRTRDDIFRKFVRKIDGASEKPDSDSVVKEFQEKIENAKNKLKAEVCQKYIDFMEMISNAEKEDGEIKTVSQTVSAIDPISKLPIVEPVKNKICGHSYEKSSIHQLIKQNPRTKCPIPGCNATEFVKKSDLVPDTALKRMLSSANTNSPKKIKLHE